MVDLWTNSKLIKMLTIGKASRQVRQLSCFDFGEEKKLNEIILSLIGQGKGGGQNVSIFARVNH